MRLLEVVGLTKRVEGLLALDGVSFTAEEGQLLGLFGPNGAGKSTCIECVAGFWPPDSGRVIFDGREVTGQPPHELARLGIARTFQSPRPFRQLTVAENVLVASARCRTATAGPLAALRTGGRGDATARARELLASVGLTSHASDKAGDLDLGKRKRLDLARALALDPRLVILDEPLGGLSDAEASRVLGFLRDLRERGLTVVLAEHHMGRAIEMVDRAVVLDHGVLVTSGRPDRVRTDRRVLEAYQGPLPAA